MGSRDFGPREQQSIELVLGYLNFSSGAPDPQFLAGLNQLFSRVTGDEAVWRLVCRSLEDELRLLSERSSAFTDISQAQAVLGLLGEHVLPGYLAFHAELLFHQSESSLFGPFFVGRVCEAILQQGPPWTETSRIVQGALAHLNDYIGHRPVPALETRRHEPYPHEWVRPIPLHVHGAGAEDGAYREIVVPALEILNRADADILETACFDLALMEELAFDPRAYDFDHPVNKRPNYHFGQWDPHRIDNQGRYRRFVVQQVTLDGLMARLGETPHIAREQLLFEAAAVLAGTMLMAAGISGRGPGTYDSGVALAGLLTNVAEYRDTFYERLIQHADPAYRQRLQEEMTERRQPFGGARQHLNAWLARRRACQMQHVHLAKLFARMGNAQAATRQATIVPVASARMICQIDCRLTAGDRAVNEGQLEQAIELVDEIVSLLHRAIECGAIVDPWNILGFDAHFSLFPALENSVHDHRVDELTALMEQLFGLFSRIWSAAAAGDRQDTRAVVQRRFHENATWWRQFAAHEVSSVDAVDAMEVYEAARNVAEALNLWHKVGAAAGDVKFWAPHADMFDSPKAFALVIEALLERGDFVVSMALLIQWLSEAGRIPLQRGASSFHELAQQWLLKLLQRARSDDASRLPESPRRLVRKFFDFLEANAGEYWNAPHFELGTAATGGELDPERDGADELLEEEDGLFSAAYEDVVFRDSTDDGIESELFDLGEATQDELSWESRRISDRLIFLSSLARLRKLTAMSRGLCVGPNGEHRDGPFDCITTMQHWIQHARANHDQLLALMEAVQRYRIPTTGVDSDALLQYDRQQVVKESLLDRIVATCVDISVAGQCTLAALAARSDVEEQAVIELAGAFGEEAPATVLVMAGLLQGDDDAVRRHWCDFTLHLEDKTLLYVPVAKGGDPPQIVGTRCRQRLLQDLLAWLPRRGMWAETCELIEIARSMENHNPVGPGAVTEFDELFKVGYRNLVESLVTAAESWDPRHAEQLLVENLENLTQVLLGSWLQHSRTLRLSVLERVNDEQSWNNLVAFIRRYGGEMFTQQFFHLGNLRAIMHQGAGNWLRRLQQDPEAQEDIRLLRELDQRIEQWKAEEQLSLVLEAIVENYGEYRDYNSTTTQSDRGEMLYTLLDFLRLRTQYDRVCWHLKPVVLAHEILVRRKHDRAAGLWRRTLMERIGDEADQYLVRLAELQKEYSMRMSTVADRLAERFVRPMIIDRIRALVRPAIEEMQQAAAHPSFDLLESETEMLASEATGIGFDVPAWLLALEEEVDRARQVTHRHNFQREMTNAVVNVALTDEQVEEQLELCDGDDDDEDDGDDECDEL